MYQKKNTTNAGRIGKYKAEYAPQIYRLALLGLTDAKIAEYFEINPSTFALWKNNQPEVKKQLTRGRVDSNLKVVSALYEKAIGYSHPDTVVLTKTVKHYDEEGKCISSETVPMIVPTTKHYPPDSFACLKILGIRQREEWTDIIKIDHQIHSDININYLLELVSDTSVFSEKDLQNALQDSIQQRLKPADATNN